MNYQPSKKSLEIKAAIIGTGITNNKDMIYRAANMGVPFKLITEAHLSFMVAMDIRGWWEKLRDSPTLFHLTPESYEEGRELGIIWDGVMPETKTYKFNELYG